jgi:hypothetical protein
MQVYIKCFVIVSLLLGVISCKKKSKAEKIPQQKFTLISEKKSNIDFLNIVQQTNDFNCLNYTYALAGGGVATADFNNDGLEDIYFTS